MGLFGLFRRKEPEAQVQELEKQLFSTPRIFVDNDALAFFDVNKPTNEPTNIAELVDKPTKKRYGQLYNFLVESKQDHYFRSNEYKGPIETVSVTTPCIVFCGYTINENGGIKASGVYHAESIPPSVEFQKRLYKLIDTVRSEPDERVVIKATGSNRDKGNLQKIREYLTEILAVKNVKIESEHLLLGGGSYRITEFYPRNGQLITYFSNSEQKTVL